MSPERGPTLLAIARHAVAEQLGEAPPAVETTPWLREPGSTFVTLRLGEALRGCVGSLWRQRALGEDVAENARGAAFRDSRFPPLVRDEYPLVRFEVSLLGPLEPFEADDEAQLLSRLRPGVDGLALQLKGRRGVFLPKVWEQLPDPRDFLDRLAAKAGLPIPFWETGIRFHRFTAMDWREVDLPVAAR